jgi:poly-gamma-glutamate synthesis protein (capsule biosynthesis protein)
VVDPEQMPELISDVVALRERVDVLICSAHWGVSVLPVELPTYEVELGHAFIYAGADAVLGHHQHILKAVEFYKGKPIFHGINNFMMDGKPGEYVENGIAREAMGSLINVFGNHLSTKAASADDKKTMLVRLRASREGIVEASYVPCQLDDEDDSPRVLEPGTPEWDEHREYVRYVTAGAGMDTRFEEHGGEIVVGPGLSRPID